MKHAQPTQSFFTTALGQWRGLPPPSGCPDGYAVDSADTYVCPSATPAKVWYEDTTCYKCAERCPDGWPYTVVNNHTQCRKPKCSEGFQAGPCPADKPVELMEESGCRMCLRAGSGACPPGYQRPTSGATFNGCPAGSDLVADVNTGCVSCVRQCSYGYTRNKPTCSIGEVAVQDRAGCYKCAPARCPYPFVPAPIICQTGWRPVRHPQSLNCAVCVPDQRPPEAPPAPLPLPNQPPSSTGVKPLTVGLVAGGALLLGLLVSRSRRG